MVRSRKSTGGYEVGVENGAELRSACLETVGQSTCLESPSVASTDVLDGDTQHAEASNEGSQALCGDVRGIIKHLNAQAISGILDARRGDDESSCDESLVVDGQLHDHMRKLRLVVVDGLPGAPPDDPI